MDNTVPDSPTPSPRVEPVPWYLYAVLIASTSVVVGVIWDISWHRSIGRDTFWTPAHLAIYLGGIIAGMSCGWLVLRTTFAGTPEEKAATVSFWGFRGPLGAWICIWGSFAMIVSAPFDDWWHNAYGLDVKVLSPPHVILALGFTAIQLGALLMMVARQNASEGGGRGAAAVRLGFAYVTGLLIANVSIMGFEQVNFWNDAHNGTYYKVAAGGFPIFLVAAASASKLRWPATIAALSYMLVTAAMVWILELFPAQAKLAPIYHPITHMVTPPFPMLMVAPALAIDLVLQRWRGRPAWLLAPVLGTAFLGVFLAVQWTAANYIVSQDAYNWFFGWNRWNYNNRPGPWWYEFWSIENDPVRAMTLVAALVLAVVSG
ncbi:MAG: hypothetical protein ACREN5_15300, partial [Gemmatimonadales bacterium]